MKLTDGFKTIDIEMNVWQETQWGPDFSADFFGDSDIDYEGTGHVKDVDYCIEQAMDWYERVGDFEDEADDEDVRSVTVDVIEDHYTYVVYADYKIISVSHREEAVTTYGEATRAHRYREVALYRIETFVHSCSKTLIQSWSSSPKITACPFCGHHEIELTPESMWNASQTATITCRHCGAAISVDAKELGDITDPFVGKIGPTYQRACTHLVNAWNRRPAK